MIEIEFLTGDDEPVGKGLMPVVPRVGETVMLQGCETYDFRELQVARVQYWVPDIADGFEGAAPDVTVFVISIEE